MNTALISIRGHWAHFKKPETNNNPLTHDFITKTALLGMIGAVLGRNRDEMQERFPILSEDLRYGVALANPVKKQSWSFTLRRFAAERSRLEVTTLSPRPFEFLREPCFRVALMLTEERSRDEFEMFVRNVADSRTHFDPVLGLHNCPADISLMARGNSIEADGRFETQGFVPRKLRPGIFPGTPFRIGMERLPTYQNNAMWNPPERYVEVVYLDANANGAALTGTGIHYNTMWEGGRKDQWCLI